MSIPGDYRLTVRGPSEGNLFTTNTIDCGKLLSVEDNAEGYDKYNNTVEYLYLTIVATDLRSVFAGHDRMIGHRGCSYNLARGRHNVAPLEVSL